MAKIIFLTFLFFLLFVFLKTGFSSEDKFMGKIFQGDVFAFFNGEYSPLVSNVYTNIFIEKGIESREFDDTPDFYLFNNYILILNYKPISRHGIVSMARTLPSELFNQIFILLKYNMQFLRLSFIDLNYFLEKELKKEIHKLRMDVNEACGRFEILATLNIKGEDQTNEYLFQFSKDLENIIIKKTNELLFTIISNSYRFRIEKEMRITDKFGNFYTAKFDTLFKKFIKLPQGYFTDNKSKKYANMRMAINSEEILIKDKNENFLGKLNPPSEIIVYSGKPSSYQNFPTLPRGNIICEKLLWKPDSDGNFYYSARSNTHWWIWKWAKVHYLPFVTNELSGSNYLMAKYKNSLALMDTGRGVLTLSGRAIELKNYIPGSFAMGFDQRDNLYLLSSNQISIYSINGTLLDFYPVTNEIEDYVISEKGCVVNYMDRKGVSQYILYLPEGEKKVSEAEMELNGWRVDKIRILAPDKSFDVAGIDIRYMGKSIREFKYGEKDNILQARILSLDEKGNVWVKVVYTDGLSGELDGKTKGEIIKFNNKGEYQNRIYLDSEAGFNDPFQDTVVINENEVYQLDGSRLIKYEKEKIEVPGLEESKSRIIDFLNKKVYTGNKRKYSDEDKAIPYDIEEDLMKLDIDYNQLLINEIYARRGYVFKEEKWREIFSKTKWYKPRKEKFVLSKLEKANMEMLAK